jgi:hypothetical protein
MFINTLKIVTTVSLMLAVTVTHAHDASKHQKKNAEKPNCEAMQNMDPSKMDSNDPIMQAMMKQCIDTDHNKAENNGSEKASKHDGDADHKDEAHTD